jgi:hypothetical protein
MIIFNRQFLFVHNPKTAGTSLLSYFRQLLPDTETVGVSKMGTHHPSLSLALGYACARTGNAPSDFRRILVTARNPYDREVSLHAHFRGDVARSLTAETDVNDPAMMEVVQKSVELPFAPYMEWLRETRGTCDIYRSEFYYRLVEGMPLPNLRVARIENLAEELADALDGLDLAAEVKIPFVNISDRGPTEEYYGSSQIYFVTECYGWLFRTGLYRPYQLKGAA